MKLLSEMRVMVNDIARSATILGATPFAGRDAAKALAESMHAAVLEYEIALAALGEHEFDVKQ
jgi:hypothetical protein